MHSIVLYSIVLHRSQLYCIVNLLLCGYNTIQCYAMHKFVGVLDNPRPLSVVIIVQSGFNFIQFWPPLSEFSGSAPVGFMLKMLSGIRALLLLQLSL